EARPCVLTLSVNGERFREKVDRDRTIGTDPGARIRLSQASGLKPFHALIARAEGGWVLHDLSGDGLRRGEEAPCPMVRLEEGVTARMGSVEINFRLKNRSSPEFVTSAPAAETEPAPPEDADQAHPDPTEEIALHSEATHAEPPHETAVAPASSG